MAKKGGIKDMNEKSESLEELCDYILKSCDDIYIKEQIDGKWDMYRLSEMPAKLALKYAMTWIKEGSIPYRIIKMINKKKVDSERTHMQKGTPETCNLGYFSEPGCDY